MTQVEFDFCRITTITDQSAFLAFLKFPHLGLQIPIKKYPARSDFPEIGKIPQGHLEKLTLHVEFLPSQPKGGLEQSQNPIRGLCKH